MSDETDDNADFLAAELAEAQAEIDALRRERDEAVARAEKLQVAYDSVRSGHGWCRCHDAIEPLTAEVARLRALALYALDVLGTDMDEPFWPGDGAVDEGWLWDKAIERGLLVQRAEPCGDENCDACGDGDRCWRYSDAVIQARAALEGK